MRLQHTQDSQTHPSENGSSLNGSSPHAANGSAKSVDTNGSMTNGHGEGDLETSRPETGPFYGLNREEVTRLILQSLSNLGYHGAAKHLSHESGYELELPSVAAFRNAVHHGEWDKAETLLFGTESADRDQGGDVYLGNGHSASIVTGTQESNGTSNHGLTLAEGADKTMLKFIIRQQKYLELLEKRDIGSALVVLRHELTPLKRDISRLHALSGLVMCQSASDLRIQAGWDGSAGQSRALLLSQISQHISPSVMIPEHRLATLLNTLQEHRTLGCTFHNTTHQPSLYTEHECSADDFPSQGLTDLKNHTDEVWYIDFSPDGTMLASAGKDGLVCIYRTSDWEPLHQIREHTRNAATENMKGVSFVAFSPDSQYLISCGQNNELVVVSTHDGRKVAVVDHFDYPVTSAAWLPDSQTFVAGSQGSRRPLGLYSIMAPATAASSNSSIVRNNELHTWRDPPWDTNLKENPMSFRITDCAVSIDGTRMAATTTDCRILLYDLRTRLPIAEWPMEDKLTSINFSADGVELLINMNEGRVLALNTTTGDITHRYEGAQQAEYVIRSAYGGAGQNFVISGSEDARVCVWRRQTGALVASLDAHRTGTTTTGDQKGTVNAVSWHPTNHGMFASCGDDKKVKIWVSPASLRPRPRMSTSIDGGSSLLPRPSSGLSSYPFTR